MNSKVSEGKASIIVIDSQGDLLRNILRLSSVAEMAERVVLINPNDIENPPALNFFDFGLDRVERYDLREREVLINGAIELYEYIFGALLGAELTQRQGVVFRYIARLMTHVPHATIHTLMDFMEQPETTRPYLKNLDPTTARFFETHFFSNDFNPTRRQILTRLYDVLSERVLNRMFSNERNKVNIFEAMNTGHLILINTAKELLKQNGCEILGRFFIALICQAAQERAAIPDREGRLPTFVYIDEAQDYFDENMGSLLEQARKFQVGLVLAHQHLGQFDRKLHATVMTNTAIKLVGGLSDDDAREFARQMRCQPDFLYGMQKYEKHTEFACFVRNTPRPVRLSVPFGQMEALPRSTAAAQAALLTQNRARYCAGGKEDGSEPDRADIAKDADSPLGHPEML
jgi:hypothetical protein